MKTDDTPGRGRLVPGPQVGARYGRSGKSLKRWIEDPKLGFPKPVVIRGRWFFYEDELDAFDRREGGDR